MVQGIDESFTYTTLFLLKINLLFANKREISLIEAIEGRKVLEWSIHDDGICFNDIDEQEEFMKTLEECSDLLYYKNGNIVLQDGVSIYNIDEKIGKIKVLRHLDYTESIFKYLNITKPIEFIEKYYELEEIIENLYMDNKDGKYSKELKKLFKERDKILEFIDKSDDDYIDMITSLNDEMYEKLEDDYILYPINLNRYDCSDHFDAAMDIKMLISMPSQTALFTHFPLFRTKVKYDLNWILDYNFEEEVNDTSDYEMDLTKEYYDSTIDSSEYLDDIDEYENEDDLDYNMTKMEDSFPDGLGASVNLSRKEIIFSLHYIKILESMKNRYSSVSSEFERLLTRLKYLNDNSDLKLYENNYNIDEIINNYSKCDDIDYLVFADEAMYFIEEIFNTYYDSFFLQKVLFIKTYYSITNDSEIVNYINEFNDNIMYEQIYEIVTGNKPSKTKKKIK